MTAWTWIGGVLSAALGLVLGVAAYRIGVLLERVSAQAGAALALVEEVRDQLDRLSLISVETDGEKDGGDQPQEPSPKLVVFPGPASVQ